MRRVFGTASFVAVAVAACGGAADPTPQIPVTPGAASRIGLIPSKTARIEGGAARVHPLAAGQGLKGGFASGRPGDYVIENDEVVFVISAIGAGAGFLESGGNVVDGADAKARVDELGVVTTYFGAFPRQAIYERATTTDDSDGAAQVEVWGRDLYEREIKVHTIYRLGRGDRALLVTTTLENGGKKASKLSLGDAIQWGSAEKTAPGKSRSFTGPSTGPYLGGIGHDVSYALTSTDGEVDGVSGATWSDTVYVKDVLLDPGKSVRYARVLLVGERGDTTSIVAELVKASAGKTGAFSVELQGDGAVVPPEDGMRAELLDAKGGVVLDVVARGGKFVGEAPPGNYRIAFAPSAGRRGKDEKPVDLIVVPGGTTRAVLKVSKPSSIEVACTEGVIPKVGEGKERVLATGREHFEFDTTPCKIVIRGEDSSGTRAPDFGAGIFAGAAKDQIIVSTNVAKVALAPGKYRMIATRGPEYAATEVPVEVVEGTSTSKVFRLERVVDTSGYVACDFHQHTSLGGDSPVGLKDRVLANAAEGVEVAVASEHNLVVDLEPTVRSLGLARFLVSIPGAEISSDASAKPFGHVGAFPLPVVPSQPRGGAPQIRDRSAHDVLEELRKRPAPPLIVVNHPRMGAMGYFDRLEFDRTKGIGRAPEYDEAFDAIEVWNGRDGVGRENVLEDFFALLKTDHPVTPIATSDTHGIVGEEPGYARTYVRLDKDDAFERWDDARTAGLVKGVRSRDVVLTNGPFLRVTSGGKGAIGGLLRADKRVDLDVHVETAPWVKIAALEVRRASGARQAGDTVALAQKGKKNARGAVAYDVHLRIAVAADEAVVVVVRGDDAMAPVLRGSGTLPFAMTGPIWVDADGDGASFGRR